mgnify:CR=1 FL=1
MARKNKTLTSEPEDFTSDLIKVGTYAIIFMTVTGTD